MTLAVKVALNPNTTNQPISWHRHARADISQSMFNQGLYSPTILSLVLQVFSSAVFGKKKAEELLHAWRRRCRGRRAKTLTFRNMSFIIEDIYLKLGVCVQYSRSNPYYQGRQFKSIFLELCPFFSYLDILSSIKHPTAERWNLHAVLLFYI